MEVPQVFFLLLEVCSGSSGCLTLEDGAVEPFRSQIGLVSCEHLDGSVLVPTVHFETAHTFCVCLIGRNS